MHSDDSIQTVFKTRDVLDNPTVDSHDGFSDSEPSPTTNFSHPPFNPLTSSGPVVFLSCNSDYSYIDAYPSPSVILAKIHIVRDFL